MKTGLRIIGRIVAICCVLAVGLATQARAETPCPTQGALALALADVLQIKTTSAQVAADALALRGIAPKLGWNVGACLTNEVTQEVKMAFDASFERARTLIDRGIDQSYEKVTAPPTVSPFKP